MPPERDLHTVFAAEPPRSFADTLALLHAARYTGPITFHFLCGTPTSAELPRPATKIRLDQSNARPL